MTATVGDLLDIGSLERSLGQLTLQYASAVPFPHIVFDDVLRPEAIQRAYVELAQIDPTSWANYLHVNERKHANTNPDTWGPMLRSISAALMSERFSSFLGQLTGFRFLRPDPTLDGGGLHRCTAGGYLNVHADFTAHHTNPLWRRRVNLLLYLNPEWQPQWGGDLELWSTDMSRREVTVAPIGNRMLVFTTADDSYHGFPAGLRSPPGVARHSLALYYFTEESERHVKPTNYRARPGDGGKRIAIYLDRQALGLYDVVKRRLRLSDDFASRRLGSINRLRSTFANGRRRAVGPTPSAGEADDSSPHP